MDSIARGLDSGRVTASRDFGSHLPTSGPSLAVATSLRCDHRADLQKLDSAQQIAHILADADVRNHHGDREAGRAGGVRAHGGSLCLLAVRVRACPDEVPRGAWRRTGARVPTP